MEERRNNEQCPKCRSRLKAIIDKNLVCIGIGCEYIYRKDVENFRAKDKSLAELKSDWS